MSKIKIVIADDDPTARLILQKGLQFEKFKDIFEVHPTKDGEEALKAYEEESPDIIILDIMMPEVSGYTALKKIRELEKGTEKHTVVIMATSMADKESIVDCANVGIEGYIVKPVSAKSIGEKILGYYRKKYPE